MADQLGGKDLVLLSYENLTKPGEWRRRKVFAEWWLRETGEVTVELVTGDEPRASSPTSPQLPLC
jgi:hypothetical protein